MNYKTNICGKSYIENFDGIFGMTNDQIRNKIIESVKNKFGGIFKG